MPDDAAPRGYAKGRRKRMEIIEAATQLFGEMGYHAASLREISSRVGISHPGLLHHFPTKEGLLAAVFEHRDTVDEALFSEDMAAGFGFFEALVRGVDRNQARPGVVEFYAMLSSEATVADHPANGYFRHRYATVIERLTQEIANLIAQDRLPAKMDVLATARSVVAIMDGLQIQWLLDRDQPEQRVDMAEALKSHLWLVGRVDLPE